MPDLTTKLVGTYSYSSNPGIPPGLQADGTNFERRFTISRIDRTTVKINNYNAITYYDRNPLFIRIDSISHNAVVKLERDDQFVYQHRNIVQGVHGPFERMGTFHAALAEGGLDLYVELTSVTPPTSENYRLFLSRE